MKRLVTVIYILLACFGCFAQDPQIVDDWYLVFTQGDLGDPYYVSEVQPPISPYIIINQDLTFEGYGACNSFEGNFIHDTVNDYLILETFTRTNNQCDFPSHSDFENNYFGYFLPGEPYVYYITISGDLYMALTSVGGFEILYAPEPILSRADFSKPEISLYPNPASEVLNLSIESHSIESINIISLSGQILLSETGPFTSINVSTFSAGIYFLEISTQNGRVVKKFVKN
ncbi:T9SS type A sorting domain-containing protein [Aureitalea sp. L0-47]|uniref:T9SS type A sorting domain-containing protein n=1 Tax=Aureitalea sp. L0-47 TaxID=2816962 RepID=UPI00223863C7|nr:T9SS type A sorting domain-containing protein [Aureitalea sp. L0-47]MCW5518983.1 T9SS type A sorting domain-containing protein [Aureitalea sp. L0-47]